MDLVLLPHHNTLTSLQKLQQKLRKLTPEGFVFLPSYPLVCVLGHTDEQNGHDDAFFRSQMQELKDMLRDADGPLTFGKVLFSPADETACILQAGIPFMDSVQKAGFRSESEPRFILGSFLKTDDAKPADADGTDLLLSDRLPASDVSAARTFRLALMKTNPLSEAGHASSPDSDSSCTLFTWKFFRTFWVKLKR